MSLLTAKQLFVAIQPLFPNGLGTNRFFEILPSLPYVKLPGGKRKFFDLAAIEIWLRAQIRVDKASDGEPVRHNHRPRLKRIA